jgi:hypothetical protein
MQAETQMRMADEQRVRAAEALKFQEAQAAAEANEERLKNMREQWSVPLPPEEKPAAPRKKSGGVGRKVKAAGACLSRSPRLLPPSRRTRRMRTTRRHGKLLAFMHVSRAPNRIVGHVRLSFTY